MALTRLASGYWHGRNMDVYEETALDAPSIGATSTGTADITVTGVTTSDKIVGATLNGTPDLGTVVLSGAYCQAANTVRFVFTNASASAAQDLAAISCVFTVVKAAN